MEQRNGLNTGTALLAVIAVVAVLVAGFATAKSLEANKRAEEAYQRTSSIIETMGLMQDHLNAMSDNRRAEASR